jgi:hypothetical protein
LKSQTLAIAAAFTSAAVGVCAQSWKPALTTDGQPDFQAVWNTATLTPLERPAEFAGKEFFTEQEATAYEKRILGEVNSDRRDGGAQADLARNYNEFWRDRANSVVASRRTSIVVDPSDGRIPSKPDALKRRIAANQSVNAGTTGGPAGPEDLALRIRCISRDLPMIPSPNNNFLRIIQATGFVAIDQEMMHEWRLIPLTDRPHADSRIRGYMGDSRGHWEGGTLVIDTTNFVGINNFYGADANMHLIERLTRTSPDTLVYRFTVDDPTAFTKPWTGELSFSRSNDVLLEYACHEGNYTMAHILAGARAAASK